MTGPGNEMAAGAAGADRLLLYREQATRTLKAALAQGRLTEDEYDERVGQASAARSHADLAALTADLPVGRMAAQARPPTVRDARICATMSISAACVVAAVLLWQPDNALAFLAFIIAAFIVLIVPIVTVGVMVDVRHQKKSGGQLPPGPTRHAG